MNQRIKAGVLRRNKLSGNAEGFTLIELSIVLVVIGLIVGGVLVGQDLIAASKIRAAISQIESYQLASNTFRAKYGDLPGDLKASTAAQLGLATRNGDQGRGDGNRIIQKPKGYASQNPGITPVEGELGLFWRDLSDAELIVERFTSAHATTSPLIAAPEDPAWANYLPKSKLGPNYVYIWSGGLNPPPGDGNGRNYIGLVIPNYMAGDWFYTQEGLTVDQAAQIDQKADDGMPQSGKVQATYVSHSPMWAIGGPIGWGGGNAPGTAAADHPLRCYDNNNVVAAAMQYSTDYTGDRTSNAQFTGFNCAVSFEMY